MSKESSSRSTLAIFATKVAIYPISFIVTIFIARSLGDTGFGQYSFLLLMGSTILPMSLIGFELGTTYQVSSKTFRVREVALTAVMFTAILGTALAFLLWNLHDRGFLGTVGNTVQAAWLLPVMVSIPIQAAQLALFRLIFGASWFSAMNTVELFGALATPALLVVLVLLLDMGVQGAAYAILARASLLFLMSLGLVVKRFGIRPWLNLDFLKKGLHYGVRAWPGTLGVQAQARFDHLVLSAVAPPQVLGWYSIATRLTELLWIPMNALAPVVFNRVAEIKDQLARTRLTEQVSRSLLTFALLGGIGLAAVSWVMIPILYGAEYNASRIPALILIPGSIALLVPKLLTKYFSGSGRPGYSSILQTITAIVTVALYFLLIPPMQANGAALASSIGYGLAAVVATVLYLKLNPGHLTQLYAARRSDVNWISDRIQGALGVWRDRLKSRGANVE